MRIGIPKEIKDHEYRVGATPATVQELIRAGHEVLVQEKMAWRIGYSDEMYMEVGAKVIREAEAIYDCDLIIKVKEPQESEYAYLKEGQVLFCFLHLAPDPQQTKALLAKKVVGIAYETVTDKQGRLPLLTPMSEVAGRIAIQAGATALQMSNGGRGVLLGGVPGVSRGNVVIIGGGIVGSHAAKMAMGLGANVTILDTNLERLREFDALYCSKLKTFYSTPQTIEKAIVDADLVVGAVLIPGKQAPKLLTREMLKKMKKGSVFVDVAIDQGGCAETSRPTTHSHPTYVEEGVVHYCVTNMPGACARTSTEALTNATLPFALNLASKGYMHALKEDPHLLKGLNVYKGYVTNRAVAQDLGYAYHAPESLFMNAAIADNLIKTH